jgi:transposase-like protein
MKVAEVCRKHGISEPTFYAWKARFGGMSVSDAKRLRQLEDENARLKKLLAEAMPEREFIEKGGPAPAAPRRHVRRLVSLD